MSALVEIEAAAATLSAAELEVLERKVHEMNLARRQSGKMFTEEDAVAWWRGRERMPVNEAEAFAHDVEEARGESAAPPRTPRWE